MNYRTLTLSRAKRKEETELKRQRKLRNAIKYQFFDVVEDDEEPETTYDYYLNPVTADLNGGHFTMHREDGSEIDITFTPYELNELYKLLESKDHEVILEQLTDYDEGYPSEVKPCMLMAFDHRTSGFYLDGNDLHDYAEVVMGCDFNLMRTDYLEDKREWELKRIFKCTAQRWRDEYASQCV